MLRGTVFLLPLMLAMAGCNRAPAPTFPTPISTAAAVPQSPVVTQFEGTVYDTAGRPLAGAAIGAWSGPEAYATSDANGRFTITCCNLDAFVSTDIFSAHKAGYATETRALGAGLNFVLAPLAASASRGRSSQ